MTQIAPRTGLLDRLLGREPRTQRLVAYDEEAGGFVRHDLLSDASSAPERRQLRTNQDMIAVVGAVYAGVRRRSRMIQRPTIVLVRDLPNGETEEIVDPNHPAVRLLKRINATTTFKQGLGLAESQGILTGKAFWIKRRDALGTVVEFEIWNPATVEIIPSLVTPWVPDKFKRYLASGGSVTVDAEDVVYFRQFLDPRNPLYGLGSIGAARVSLDTGLEAQRYNQRFFDNDAIPAKMYSVGDGGPAEVARIEQQLGSKSKGTDNAHRTIIIEGTLQDLGGAISQKDMEFLAQMRWTVEEAARVLELAPILLGDFTHGTYENVGNVMRDAWTMMQDETGSKLDALNEFLLAPDFGEEYRYIAKYDHIPELQEDRERQARIDEIYAKYGKESINEQRNRDKQEPVEWGERPLLPNTIVPLAMPGDEPAEEPAAPPGPGSGGGGGAGVLDDLAPMAGKAGALGGLLRSREDALRDFVRGLLSAELRKLLGVINKNANIGPEPGEQASAEGVYPERAGVPPDITGGYGWDWSEYGEDMSGHLESIYAGALKEAGYLPLGLDPAHEVAVRYAQTRGGALLKLDGPENIVAHTRQRVGQLVADSIEKGESIRQLKNKLRTDLAFSDSRAQTIARTETALAQGQATLVSYRSMGFEGKEWSWPGGKGDGICDINHGQVVKLTAAFASGHMTVPGHPNCRCALLPVRVMPVEGNTGDLPAAEAEQEKLERARAEAGHEHQVLVDARREFGTKWGQPPARGEYYPSDMTRPGGSIWRWNKLSAEKQKVLAAEVKQLDKKAAAAFRKYLKAVDAQDAATVKVAKAERAAVADPAKATPKLRKTVAATDQAAAELPDFTDQYNWYSDAARKATGEKFSKKRVELVEELMGAREDLIFAAADRLKVDVETFMLWAEGDVQVANGIRAAIAERFGIPTLLKGTQEGKAMADAMYEATQAFFQERGITSVRLARGLRFDGALPDELAQAVASGNAEVAMSEMSSWTTDMGWAIDFASHGKSGVVLYADIPVQRIVSTPFTGLGDGAQFEFMVAGPTMSVQVTDVASMTKAWLEAGHELVEDLL